jgi:hypothetical protein
VPRDELQNGGFGNADFNPKRKNKTKKLHVVDVG